MGTNGTILFNDGLGWNPQASGTTDVLMAVTSPDADHAWAVGQDGLILFDGGTGWAPEASGVSTWLYGACALDAAHAWAVGQDGVILFNDGTGWAPQASGTTEWLYGVCATTPDDAWAVGANGTVLRYDGAAWAPQDSGIYDGRNLYGVSALDAAHAWAVGDEGLMLYYDGLAWSEQPTGVPGFLWGVFALDAGHVWAVGDRGVIIAGAAPDPARWYLAEGCTQGGMETFVLVQNPNPVDVTVDLTLQTSSGEQKPAGLQGRVIPAGTRSTFPLHDYLQEWDVSTLVIPTGGEVICERAMYGDGRAWAHDSVGVTAPADEWFLAEGCTQGGMETFVLVQNPGAADAVVDLTCQTGEGEVAPPLLQGQVIPAGSRRSFKLNDYLVAWDVSTRVSASEGEVICERAMYGNDRTWAHDSIGASAPAAEWYLAEGCTEGGMETFVLVQNPGGAPVTVDLTLQTSTGEQSPAGLQGQVIPAGSRRSFKLNDHVADWDVSTRVSRDRRRGRLRARHVRGQPHLGPRLRRRHRRGRGLVPGGRLHAGRHGDLGAGAEPRLNRRHRRPHPADLHGRAEPRRPAGPGHTGRLPPLLQAERPRRRLERLHPGQRDRRRGRLRARHVRGQPHLGPRLRRLHPVNRYLGQRLGRRRIIRTLLD